jgi:hypothetical protein
VQFDETSAPREARGPQFSLIAALALVLAAIVFLQWPALRTGGAQEAARRPPEPPAQAPVAAASVQSGVSVYTYYLVGSDEQGEQATRLITAMQLDDSLASTNWGIAIVRSPEVERMWRGSIEGSNEEQSLHPGQVVRIVDLRPVLP